MGRVYFSLLTISNATCYISSSESDVGLIVGDIGNSSEVNSYEKSRVVIENVTSNDSSFKCLNSTTYSPEYFSLFYNCSCSQ